MKLKESIGWVGGEAWDRNDTNVWHKILKNIKSLNQYVKHTIKIGTHSQKHGGSGFELGVMWFSRAVSQILFSQRIKNVGFVQKCPCMSWFHGREPPRDSLIIPCDFKSDEEVGIM